METNKNNATQWKIIFRTLPVLGFLLLTAGAAHMVYMVHPAILDFIALAVGILLFLTLFLRAEVANIKYYANVLSYTVFVFIFCTVGYMFARSRSVQIDLTKNKYFSLSDQSRKVVKNLKKDLEIVVFYPDSQAFLPIVDRYNSAGGSKLKWTFVDARKDPLAANKYGENIKNGTIVLKCGQKTKRMTIDDLSANYENALTNAIIEVSRDKSLKVYIVTGHGELATEQAQQPRMRRGPSAEEQEPTLATFKKKLNEQGVQTDLLNLSQKSFVPEDAAAVILAGPQVDLLPSEIESLKKYLDVEGKLFISLDVPHTAMGMASAMPNLKALLKKYGVEVQDKVILDLVGNQLTGSPIHPMITWLNPEQVITSEFSQRMMNLFLGQARPVLSLNDPSTGYKVTELLKTSPESWAEDLTVLSSGKTTPPAQRTPQSVGVAVTLAPPPAQPGQPAPPEPKSGMRMVVFGTSDLVGDQYQQTNQVAVALMKGSINWLTQQEDLIAIPPRQLEGTPIILDIGQYRMIIILAILLIPGLLFFGGLSYTLSRQRR